ncbi:MAG TPA: hypothetical protein VK463_21180 [Desulfomonilaceae bacterium]|nr:hypothetical protein [Desulfomonilaceae bacterium]
MTKPATRKTARTSSVEAKRLTLNERLALIGLIDESTRESSSDATIVTDLFTELGDLLETTISGAKIDRLKSGRSNNGFKVLEINAETGENLGRLNMLYLNKPIPCYYLVYVEVAPPFRNKGLGNKILEAFRDFLIEKAAVGILDNIIPQDDPTYDIYLKLNWKPAVDFTGVAVNGDGVYMVFVPPALAGKDLKDALLRLVHHLKRKRATIDMRDNELMVKRTIEEFKDLYCALVAYFEVEIRRGKDDSFMRFMFTRFVTKLLGFRRRISELLGYTGGESLEQVVLDPEIRALPVQSYAPRDLANSSSFVTGDKELWLHLPESLKTNPARMIEALQNYKRPNLLLWLESKDAASDQVLTIGDLLDLGFDPTRLKEITIHGEHYIFERLQARMLKRLDLKKELMERIEPEITGVRIRNATLALNPPLLVIKDRGNAYVLRRKVQGIHWEEAMEQLQTCADLKNLNAALKLEKLILSTVRKTQDWLKAATLEDEEMLRDTFTYFMSWNIDANQPKLMVDASGTFLDTIWIA